MENFDRPLASASGFFMQSTDKHESI